MFQQSVLHLARRRDVNHGRPTLNVGITETNFFFKATPSYHIGVKGNIYLLGRDRHVGGCGGGIIDGSGGDYLDAGRIGIQLKAAIFTLHSIVAVLLVFHHRQVPIRSSRFRRYQHDPFRVARRNDRVDLRILVMNSPRFKRRLVVHFTDDVAVNLEFYGQREKISHLFTQKNDAQSFFTCLRRGVISTTEDIGCCCNERSADEMASS